MTASVTNAQNFLAAIVEPIRDLETMFRQLIAMRDVRYAIGVHLDRLGKIVGRPRNGVTDDDVYRRYVAAQIAVNRSSGTVDEILAIAELVVFDDDAEYLLDNTGVAAFVLRIEDIELDWTVAKTLIEMLRKAVQGGVRVILEWWTTDDPAEAFAFDGENEGAGFPEYDGSGGGQFISAME